MGQDDARAAAVDREVKGNQSMDARDWIIVIWATNSTSNLVLLSFGYQFYLFIYIFIIFVLSKKRDKETEASKHGGGVHRR